MPAALAIEKSSNVIVNVPSALWNRAAVPVAVPSTPWNVPLLTGAATLGDALCSIIDSLGIALCSIIDSLGIALCSTIADGAGVAAHPAASGRAPGQGGDHGDRCRPRRRWVELRGRGMSALLDSSTG